jgi:hypothetical protein
MGSGSTNRRRCVGWRRCWACRQRSSRRSAFPRSVARCSRLSPNISALEQEGSPLKGRIHLRRSVDRPFTFPLQSDGGPYISGNVTCTISRLYRQVDWSRSSLSDLAIWHQLRPHRPLSRAKLPKTRFFVHFAKLVSSFGRIVSEWPTTPVRSRAKGSRSDGNREHSVPASCHGLFLSGSFDGAWKAPQ